MITILKKTMSEGRTYKTDGHIRNRYDEELADKEDYGKQRKHHKVEKDIPIMGWVTPLTNTIYIGPLPYTSDEVRYLTKTCQVSLFVNLLPESNTRRDAYKKYFGLDTTCTIKSFPLDLASHNIKGRLKTDQQQSTAVVYVNLARAIVAFYKKTYTGKVMYIHSKTGFLDEAFIGFAVWQLLYPETFPADPVKWIEMNHYKMLLDDDADNKELLRLTCAEAKRIVTASKYFVIDKK